MNTSEIDLDHVYGAGSVSETHEIYQNWAAAYDEDNLKKGYRLATVAAGLVARYVKPDTGPILDAGCGTGLIGEALSILGYGVIDGLDLSEEMLEAARSRGVYRKLGIQELGKQIGGPTGCYAACTCFGSFGPGHAPPKSLDEFVRIVRPNGHIIFNVRDDTYVEQGFAAKIDGLTAAGKWRELERSRVFRAFLLAEPEITVITFVFAVS